MFTAGAKGEGGFETTEPSGAGRKRKEFRLKLAEGKSGYGASNGASVAGYGSTSESGARRLLRTGNPAGMGSGDTAPPESRNAMPWSTVQSVAISTSVGTSSR